jgi:hypothetical protein
MFLCLSRDIYINIVLNAKVEYVKEAEKYRCSAVQLGDNAVIRLKILLPSSGSKIKMV